MWSNNVMVKKAPPVSLKLRKDTDAPYRETVKDAHIERYERIERRITTPTIGTLHVGNIHIHEAVMRVFGRYGNGPFALDALVHLAIQDLDVTPWNYHKISSRAREYLVAHFEVKQGQLLPSSQVSVRSIMISYKEDV